MQNRKQVRFFFAMVGAGAVFSLFIFILFFTGLRYAFPKISVGLTPLDIGRGILAELTTVSNWGRLGREGSK